jgi:hypothetical protein
LEASPLDCCAAPLFGGREGMLILRVMTLLGSETFSFDFRVTLMFLYTTL